jgi:hypothetical protein
LDAFNERINKDNEGTNSETAYPIVPKINALDAWFSLNFKYPVSFA